MHELRALIKGEVFDYQILKYCLRDYKKPRDKVTLLLESGNLIRLKRGLYTFGGPYRKGLISLEVVAAMLVQPSYISREYALQRFLPERVERVTSITTRKKKHFETAIGKFDYYSISREKFSVGVAAKDVPQEGGYLCATKEKALADWVASLPLIPSKENLDFFLFEEARIDAAALLPLDRPLLEEICKLYRNSNVELLLQL